MNRYFLAALIILAMPVCTLGEGVATGARSPGDMSPEERMDIMRTASKYDNCIYSHAVSSVGDFPDIRQAADFAMGKCQNKLTDLEASITAMGFGSDFATAFSKRIRSRAARKILPELAIRKAGG
ncbi:MAG: hypothetical protein QF609_02785 [Gammaproteobacteria bacterium]|jgi:hypothetical protein|nr:hypothetical protein [Gammaproteobacteria bacterium]HJP36700.1 hypothetical protein [Gammaproteobacteria bacterium]